MSAAGRFAVANTRDTREEEFKPQKGAEGAKSSRSIFD
jgi:hypothetical protein